MVRAAAIALFAFWLGACASSPASGGASATPEPLADDNKSERGMEADHITQLDRDGDGVVERSEFDAGRWAEFARADLDRSGALEGAELARLRPPKHGGNKGTRNRSDGRNHKLGKRGKLFARADTNGDGVVTRVEVRATAMAKFARLDKDGDGRLQADELREWKNGPRHQASGRNGHLPPAADEDEDGFVDAEEFVAASWTRMARADVDRDGQVDRAELGSMKMTGLHDVEDIDDNDDGVLTREEFAAASRRFFAHLDQDNSGALERSELRRRNERR